MSDPTLSAALREGAAALGLALADAQVEALLAYLELLQKWNRVYNLTAVREPLPMLRHHLLDSMAAIGPLRRTLLARGASAGARLLDVGSGGGLPGVVVAICCPDIHVTCVDAVAKKSAFIRQSAASLALANLESVHARVENMPGRFDIVCSRAFASMADFVAWTAPLLAPGACWMAMKGQHPADEIAALPDTVRVFHVEQLQVPGLDAQRCIVWLEPVPSGA
ncbi:MAG: 16S rRNA (guanine(527)-N(7))-methyltransferase RsmG [Burkholderiaceae bacterium]|nr:16S rRNA (guanine(527)-N(7))-methyltransferase RsmG [Rhodoferax sp.]